MVPYNGLYDRKFFFCPFHFFHFFHLFAWSIFDRRCNCFVVDAGTGKATAAAGFVSTAGGGTIAAGGLQVYAGTTIHTGGLNVVATGATVTAGKD